MTRIRVYQLAKELDISNKEMIIQLNEMGVYVKSHSSQLDDTTVEIFRKKCKPIVRKEYIEQNIKLGVIRRIPITESESRSTDSIISERSLKAIDRYNERISLNPRDGYAYMERGDVHIHLGNPKEALNNYRRAIEINHRFIKAYYGMATAHIMLGSTKHALAEITRAIELEQQPDDGQYDLLQREDIKCNPISMSDFEKHLSILIEDYLNNGEDINNAIKLIGMDIDNLSRDNLTAEDFASLITEQLKDSGHLNKMLLDISRSEEVIKYDLWHLLSSYNDKMVDR